MAVFANTLESCQRLDFQMLRDGGISLYRSAKYLREDMAWLEAQGYDITSFDCASWTTLDGMHGALQENLGFPSYYGRNLNALNDCLRDLEISDTGGRAVVLTRVDTFIAHADTHWSAAEGLLDIFAGASRQAMLFGRRLVVLVQTEDRDLNFATLGAVAALWNRREWMQRS
jgi:hypothetical protein